MPADISTSYLGLRLKSPIVMGSSPLTLNPEFVRELAVAGVGAIVLPSLFEEQIVHELLGRGEQAQAAETQVESLNYEPKEDDYNGGPQAYVSTIRMLKAITDMPVIGSLNGCTGGRWLAFAAQIQEAGADALEISLESAMLDPSLGADEIEQRMIDCISDLCDQVSIPVSVKLSPFHTNLPNLAWRLIEAGASGFVCFSHNTNWQVSTDSIAATLNWSLTPPSSINQTVSGLIRVRSGGPSISVAASGGISSVADIIKSVIAGADVTMITSEIHRSGPSIVARLTQGIAVYLSDRGLKTFDDLVRSRPTPKSYLRSEYLNCLICPGRQEDPSAPIPTQEGDRWGHLL
jgi:dihydroorotate dehydrogenase (fumarate)